MWSAGTLAVAITLSLPVVTVASFVLYPAADVWAHLAATVLDDYIRNSLLLMVGVATGTFLLGVSTAWLCSTCRFPGDSVFGWALLLPLAIPAYIIAYTYTGMLDFAGPVQTELRARFGWEYGDYWFPPVRSLGGAIVMLSLVLYPYVYLLARAAFLEQSVCTLEVARSLGAAPSAAFRRIALPMARPAIITGLSLVMMETLADYGTVQYFGVSTFTTGIFRTWFGLGNAAAAAQLAAGLLAFIFVLIGLERWSRRQARFHHTSQRYRPLPRLELRGTQAAGAFIVCLVPLLLGFLVPAGQLLAWTISTADRMLDVEFFQLAANSLLLAATAAAVTLALALLMAYGKRVRNTRTVAFAVNLAGLGYAIPGAVIAIGVVIPFAWLDNTLDAWMRATFGIATGLLLSGTLIALIFAYTVRFLAVSLHTVEAGLGKINPSMDTAARSLGRTPGQVLQEIHMPLMRGTWLTALLLVFVDVMKELPATLVMRPFDFNTLAVRAFELASDERLADSSSAALAIVLAGVIPVVLLSRSISRVRPGHGQPA